VHCITPVQVWLDSININAVRGQGFCLHFMSDYQGVTGKAFAAQYQDARGFVNIEKMQDANSSPQYCGNWCILGSSLEAGKALTVSQQLLALVR
jgi:hypothetical protein